MILINLMWSSMSFFLRLLSNVIIFFLNRKEYGPEKFGHFSTLVLFATGVTLLADLGTHQRLFKEISIGRGDKIYIFVKAFIYFGFFFIGIVLSIFNYSIDLFL